MTINCYNAMHHRHQQKTQGIATMVCSKSPELMSKDIRPTNTVSTVDDSLARTYHMYKLIADSVCEKTASVIQSRNQLVQTRPLYFLTFNVCQRVVKVKHVAALLQLPNDQSCLVCSRRIYNRHSSCHITPTTNTQHKACAYNNTR